MLALPLLRGEFQNILVNNMLYQRIVTEEQLVKVRGHAANLVQGAFDQRPRGHVAQGLIGLVTGKSGGLAAGGAVGTRSAAFFLQAVDQAQDAAERVNRDDVVGRSGRHAG